MKLKTEIESRIPDELLHVFKCIGFWNEQGLNIYEQNKAGKTGSKFTQDEARKVTFETFIFNCLLSDLKQLSESTSTGYWPKGFKYGKGGSHIWISNPENERTLFIHF